ncbi:hypothetical protein [Rhizobium fabae]|uniref:Uncharacterized protein n=1 Tax=Rhizobium fabae TaxID=573179 RepID=A0A7W6B5L2_9HYPH|nr:hypothetical protein [Rhizobium fabae]MBB3916017.1 hypothetical protein [Rhizobium fabae]RUM11038.1 hypothetical protein EFB14_19330 [Rhizobium fabae]
MTTLRDQYGVIAKVLNLVIYAIHHAWAAVNSLKLSRLVFLFHGIPVDLLVRFCNCHIKQIYNHSHPMALLRDVFCCLQFLAELH